MNVKDYHIIYFYSFEDECFLARIPDLPGCIADGKTIAEAIHNVRAAAKDWLEITAQYGEHLPEPSLLSFPDGAELSIFDVAMHILKRAGEMTTKALQKLLYYCKAWSCGWYEKPLFRESFEAWIGGPMNKMLFDKHSGRKFIRPLEIDLGPTKELSEKQKQFVNQILDVYLQFDPDALGEMTHQEEPWTIARKGLKADERGNQEITEQSMVSYYGQARYIA